MSRLVSCSPMKMGTVDVERYTGPCLITTAVRPKPKPRPSVANNDSSSALTSSSNGADCDNKHVSSGAGGGGGSNGGPISHHHQHHYPQLPINDPRNWAGAPLLSMAASIRKTKNGGGNNGAGCGGGGGGGGGVNKNWHPPPVYLPAPIMHPATAMEGYAPHSSHLQGAPLIRVPRQQQQQQQQQSFHKKNNNMPVVVHGPSSMAAVSARRPLVYHQPTMLTPTPVTPPSPLPVAALLGQQSTGLQSTVVTPMEMTSENGDAGSSSGCPSSSSDTCSVTSDEGLASGGSDSSLPRIIKPRKRRKKPGQESSSLLFHHHHHQRVATKGHHNNNGGGGGGIVAQDLTGSTALSELDDLLSNQGDSLAQLFRHTSLLSTAKTGCNSSSSSSTTSSSSSSGAATTTTSGSDNCIVASAQSPPLWPGQSCVEDDIWSSGCWHSLSPVWSPSGSSSGHPSPSSSSSSCWPDQRVIRRPDRQRNHGGQFQVQTSPSSVPYLDLPTSSFLTGMPELMQQQQQQQPQHFQPEEDRRRHNLLGNDLQLHLDSPPPPLGHYLQVSSQLIASPFNGHRDIEIRFFSSTAQATLNNNNNTVTTATEEMGDVVVVAGPEQLLNNSNNNSREHSVSSSPDFPR